MPSSQESYDSISTKVQQPKQRMYGGEMLLLHVGPKCTWPNMSFKNMYTVIIQQSKNNLALENMPFPNENYG